MAGREHMLVFRDVGAPPPGGLPPAELAELLARWRKWHDRLSSQGLLQWGSALDLPAGTWRRRVGESAFGAASADAERVVGYLVVAVADPAAAARVAAGCPGLDYGFEVDIYPCRPGGSDR